MVTPQKNLRKRLQFHYCCSRRIAFGATIAICFLMTFHLISMNDYESTIKSMYPSFPSSSSSSSCYPKKAPRPLKNRQEFGQLLQEYGYTTGAEVGVKQGEFAEKLLSIWTNCKNYKLVDLWDHQENYEDIANVNKETHDQFMKDTERRMKPYGDKVEFYRMYSTEAAKKMKKESIDFVYIDARHDYCGVMEDIKAYWPLVTPGGIMAGHDYNENNEVRGQDWGLCGDGTRNEMAVKGAVNDFFLSKGLMVSVTYYRENNFMSWMVQKPLC